MGEMSKSPEEIKKDLAAWGTGVRIDIGCGEFVPPTPEYMLNGVRSADVCRDALAYIQQLEAQVPKWISVEERLPEAKLAVLAYGRRHIRKTDTTELPAQHVAYTRGEDEGWFTWDYGDYVYVSHWMPLPEPPEEGT